VARTHLTDWDGRVSVIKNVRGNRLNQDMYDLAEIGRIIALVC
jgi:hypothetical protein